MACVQAEMTFRNYPGLGGELHLSFHLQLITPGAQSRLKITPNEIDKPLNMKRSRAHTF